MAIDLHHVHQAAKADLPKFCFLLQLNRCAGNAGSANQVHSGAAMDLQI